MRVVKRIVRLIWGDDVEPEIRPLLYVGLAGSLSASSLWTFMGIWAVDKLGAEGQKRVRAMHSAVTESTKLGELFKQYAR